MSAEEKEILSREIKRLMSPLAPDSKSYQDYALLLAVMDAGVIPEEFVGVLEQILEITLSSGHIRHVYGPPEEQQLLRLYDRTPTGARARELIKQVNRSLGTLKEHKIESLSFSLKTPGVYRLEIGTDQCEMTLNIDWTGVSVHQLEVGV